MPTPNRLSELIASFRGKRLVVFGDLIADEYVYGRVARVSREAPVLISCPWSAAMNRAGGCSRCCLAASNDRDWLGPAATAPR